MSETKPKYPYKPMNAGKPIKYTKELYDAKPDCEHVVFDAFWEGGGVRCGKCGGWFCY